MLLQRLLAFFTAELFEKLLTTDKCYQWKHCYRYVLYLAQSNCVEVMTVCSEAGLFHQPASGSYLVVSAKSGPHLL